MNRDNLKLIGTFNETIVQVHLFTVCTFLHRTAESLGRKVGCLSLPLAPSREDNPSERRLFLAIWCFGAQEAQAYASDYMP